jgi:hypothetical protein
MVVVGQGARPCIGGMARNPRRCSLGGWRDGNSRQIWLLWGAFPPSGGVIREGLLPPAAQQRAGVACTAAGGGLEGRVAAQQVNVCV